MSYAVTWTENGGPSYAGRAELESGAMTLTGGGSERREAGCRVPLANLSEIYLDRSTDPGGRTLLMLVDRDGPQIAVRVLDGLGALHELAERIVNARAEAAARDDSGAGARFGATMAGVEQRRRLGKERTRRAGLRS